MFFSRRSDGTRVPDLSPQRRLEPYMMTTRLEAMVFYPQRIQVDPLLAWLQQVNEGRPAAERYSFFHVYLTALARLFRQRPELNRFVSGRRTYVHKDISFSFTVKKALTDQAPETQVRMVFTGTETVAQVRDRVNSELVRARGAEPSEGDRLIEAVAGLPRPVVATFARAVWALDNHNVLPRFLREVIPVYASAYLVNLGSLGAEAPFHHLYQRGTASVFAAIGAIRKEAVVDGAGAVVARDCVTVVYSIDERATQGYYFVKSARILEEMLAAPERLLQPPQE